LCCGWLVGWLLGWWWVWGLGHMGFRFKDGGAAVGVRRRPSQFAQGQDRQTQAAAFLKTASECPAAATTTTTQCHQATPVRPSVCMDCCCCNQVLLRSAPQAGPSSPASPFGRNPDPTDRTTRHKHRPPSTPPHASIPPRPPKSIPVRTHTTLTSSVRVGAPASPPGTGAAMPPPAGAP
jgi:hypothetical protein